MIPFQANLSALLDLKKLCMKTIDHHAHLVLNKSDRFLALQMFVMFFTDLKILCFLSIDCR